jgi:hypothetical protein
MNHSLIDTSEASNMLSSQSFLGLLGISARTIDTIAQSSS